MQVADVTTARTSPASSYRTSELSQDDFFTLLTAQLRAQNPLEPMTDQQFLGELANFASLEQTSRVNDNLLGLALLQENLAITEQLTQGSQLIGLEVEYADQTTGESRRGQVEAVRLEEGRVTLDLGNATTPLQAVTGVFKPETPGA
ncbi:MAG: flagellar hook capping FlgD N-terminal domain-containing protein [Planctomycetota bacterium]